jgi:UDP-2-acetamido-3-amino-2,3-dideoxy-glucuronate N-acetyltransferase
MTYYKHETAICESVTIGDGTRIWAFSHVLPAAKIGKDCNICDLVFIENDVVLGDRVTIKSGVQLWDGIRISDDVFIGPNVTFSNDKYPRSKQFPDEYPVTQIEQGASIGANSTILPGITIGEGCMIGAGSVVTKSVPAFAIAYGNPAQIQGYSQSLQVAHNSGDFNFTSPGSKLTLPGGAYLVDLQNASDARGSLMSVELLGFDEFKVERIFFVYDVPTNHVRGEHAHKKCEQMLVSLSGSLKVILDDGKYRAEVKLESPAVGLVVPPKVWGTQYHFSSGAVLAVFASRKYESDDYLRNYKEFKQYISTTET